MAEKAKIMCQKAETIAPGALEPSASSSAALAAIAACRQAALWRFWLAMREMVARLENRPKALEAGGGGGGAYRQREKLRAASALCTRYAQPISMRQAHHRGAFRSNAALAFGGIVGILIMCVLGAGVSCVRTARRLLCVISRVIRASIILPIFWRKINNRVA